MTSAPLCPDCANAVQPDWDWCMACGFDPEGLRPPEWSPAAQAAAGSRSSTATLTRPAPAPAPNAASNGAPVGDWQYVPTPMRREPTASDPGVLTVIIAIVVGLGLIAAVGWFTVGHRAVTAAVSTKEGAGASDPGAVTSPDGAFTVSVDGPPRLEDRPQADGSVLHLYGWDGGPNAQLVAFADLPAAPPPDAAQPVLTGAVDHMVGGQGTSTPTTVAGHDGVQFTAYGSVPMTGVAFLDGTRLYLVVAAGPYAAAQPQAQQFVSSFHLNH